MSAREKSLILIVIELCMGLVGGQVGSLFSLTDIKCPFNRGKFYCQTRREAETESYGSQIVRQPGCIPIPYWSFLFASGAISGEVFMRIISRLLCCLVVLSLAACVVPMDFDMKMQAKKEGLYTSYEGEVLCVPVFASRDEMTKSQKAKLMAEVNDGFRQRAVKSGGAFESEYTLDGYMDIEISGNYKYEKLRNYRLNDFLTIKEVSDGVFRITSPS